MRRVWLSVVMVFFVGCECGGPGGGDAGVDASTPSPAELAWPSGAKLEIAAATGTSADLRWPAASGPVAKYRLTLDGAAQDVVAPGFTVNGLVIGRHVAVEVIAVGTDGAQTPPLRAEVAASEPLIVPPGDLSTDFCGANAFLQRGDDIPCEQLAVVVGHVRTRDGVGVPGMRVSVLNHPEWGEAVSQVDGLFSIAVAAGRHTITLASDSFVRIQRNVAGVAGDFIYMPDTVVLRRDSAATPISLPGGGFHQATRQTDRDGARTTSVFIPPGTHASLRFADGGTQPTATVTLRATEATVGASGPAAMPGTLPEATAYTYAADVSADEALAADALGVQFDATVALYTDNYLHYPVGAFIPLGAYDETRGAWESLENAVVIEVGAGGATTPSVALLPGEAELLAQRFEVGTQLVRNLTTHFSTIDTNCRWACDGSCEAAGTAEVAAREPHCDGECGSLIRVQNRTLSEFVGVAGTPFTLGWHSNRGQVRQPAVAMSLPGLDDGGSPAGLAGTFFRLDIAGRQFLDENPDGGPGARRTFTWDGTDVFGRKLAGPTFAKASTAFGYQAVAKSAPRDGGSPLSFGGWTSKDDLVVSKTRQVVYFARPHALEVGDWSPREKLGNSRSISSTAIRIRPRSTSEAASTSRRAPTRSCVESPAAGASMSSNCQTQASTTSTCGTRRPWWRRVRASSTSTQNRPSYASLMDIWRCSLARILTASRVMAWRRAPPAIRESTGWSQTRPAISMWLMRVTSESEK